MKLIIIVSFSLVRKMRDMAFRTPSMYAVVQERYTGKGKSENKTNVNKAEQCCIHVHGFLKLLLEHF
jgi:hypothetical protein